MDYYGLVGALSTLISIILGVVSIVYTYISGKETSELSSEMSKQIKEIADQNEAFIRNIKVELLKSNYDDDNIKNIQRHMDMTKKKGAQK